MSKKPKKTSKFSYTPTLELPKLKKVKTEWDLKKHYYKSTKDPQIEKDLKKTEKAFAAFAKRYRKAKFTTSVPVLVRALKDLEKINTDPATARPGRYFGLRTALNSGDEAANKMLNLTNGLRINIM